jgi:hypothetical protein
MKLAIRIFALFVVVVGVAAAATTSKTAPVVIQSHQSATATMPAPCGGPHVGCYASPSGN